jgi:pyridoxal 5'-phosphate synthase pdxT subunit
LAQLRVGILALQGDVAEHAAAIERAGALPVAVKRLDQLQAVDGLIIPGGESTTVIRLLDRAALSGPLVARVRDGMPLWGTCMGMIVTAREVAGVDQPTLDILDVTVRRNALGRQNDSVEVPLRIPVLGPAPFPAVFIRAPWIERAGNGVEILAERDGHGVMVREGNVLGTSFHPELTHDERVHAYFLSMMDTRDDVGKASSAA